MVHINIKNNHNQPKERPDHVFQEIEDVLIELVHELTKQCIKRQEELGFGGISTKDFLDVYPNEDYGQIVRMQILQLQRDIKELQRQAELCWPRNYNGSVQ